MAVLPYIKDAVVDTVFADPPFNLGKEYGENCNDLKPDDEYLIWCKAWIAECVRTLKPGGAFFLYNLPKWNVLLGVHLAELGMAFRHWIAVEISACLPIPGRLHPSHYSLLYYTKGKPKTFRRIRTPIQTCRHCGGEVKDYGGHRGAMNPKGVNLKDVWTDIPPVLGLSDLDESSMPINYVGVFKEACKLGETTFFESGSVELACKRSPSHIV